MVLPHFPGGLRAGVAITLAALLVACDGARLVPLRTERLGGPDRALPQAATVLSDHGVGLTGRVRAPLADLVQREAASVLANNGGDIVSNNAGGLISNNGGGIVANHGAGYRLAYAESDLVQLAGAHIGLEALDGSAFAGPTLTTDLAGVFTLAAPAVPVARYMVGASATVGDRALTLLALVEPGATAVELDPATTLVAKKVRATRSGQVSAAMAADLARLLVPLMSDRAAVAAVLLGPEPAANVFDALAATNLDLGTAAATAGLARPRPTPTPAPTASPTATPDTRPPAGGGTGADPAPAPTPTPTPAPPTINTLVPTSGSPGTRLTIAGTGFGATPADNTVMVAGVAATVLQALPSQLVVLVPAQVGSGVVTVTVGGQTAAGAQGFTAVAAGTRLGHYTVGSGPSRIAIDAAGNAWISNLTSNSVSKLAPDGTVLGTFAVPAGPQGVAVDGRGIVWVTSASTGKVVQLDASGNTVATIPVDATRTVGIAIDAGGTAWTTRTSSGTISTLSPTGSVVGTFSTGTGPYGVAFDASGNAWVANNGAGSVSKLAPDGTNLGTFPTGASPNSLVVDAAGDIWVANGAANTVTHLAPDGSLRGNSPVGTSPFGIAIGADGRIWVSNSGSNTLTQLAPDGTVLSNRPTDLGPLGLTFDARGYLWEANFGGGTVSVFAP
ncbi:MAG: repeat containing protein [Cyanobacteria bacterium RYN_339]|nr:repeat containing protein [Cyanobacteria bacterium RYN_339]